MGRTSVNRATVDKLAKQLNLSVRGKSGNYLVKNEKFKTLELVYQALLEIQSQSQNNEPTATTTNSASRDNSSIKPTESARVSENNSDKSTISATLRDRTCTSLSAIVESVSRAIRTTDTCNNFDNFLANFENELQDQRLNELLKLAEQISNESKSIAYDFSKAIGLKPCGDYLIAASQSKRCNDNSDYLYAHRFFKCENTIQPLINYAHFTEIDGEWIYKGHIFRDATTGYWLDNEGVYISIKDLLCGLDCNDKLTLEVTDENWLLLS